VSREGKHYRRGVCPEKITDKQRVFIEQYTIDYNAARAARVAGYKYPYKAATRLLDGESYPNVARAVGKIQGDVVRNAKLSRDQLVEEISVLAMRDPLDIL
jgi:phage terminase small subunit